MGRHKIWQVTVCTHVPAIYRLGIARLSTLQLHDIVLTFMNCNWCCVWVGNNCNVLGMSSTACSPCRPQRCWHSVAHYGSCSAVHWVQDEDVEKLNHSQCLEHIQNSYWLLSHYDRELFAQTQHPQYQDNDAYDKHGHGKEKQHWQAGCIYGSSKPVFMQKPHIASSVANCAPPMNAYMGHGICSMQ